MNGDQSRGRCNSTSIGGNPVLISKYEEAEATCLLEDCARRFNRWRRNSSTPCFENLRKTAVLNYSIGRRCNVSYPGSGGKREVE